MKARPYQKVNPVMALSAITLVAFIFGSTKGMEKYCIGENLPDHLYQELAKVNESQLVPVPNSSSLCPLANKSECKLDKAHPCKLMRYIHTKNNVHGLISAVEESNINVSTVQSLCFNGQVVVLGEEQNSSLVQTLCHRSLDSTVYKVDSHNEVTILPGWGARWPSINADLFWPEYSTGILTSEGLICFWPKVPKLGEAENDLSLWTSTQSKKRLEKPIQRQKVMFSEGFFGNFWHAMAVLDVWCRMREDDDLQFAVQLEDDESVPPYLYTWAMALGISKDRIIIHNGPVIADEVLAAHYRDIDVDWSCLHEVLHPHHEKPTMEQHALIYFRSHSGVFRDIPKDIHLELVNMLGEQIPDLVVKTFYGTESFEEVRELFSNARIVIGPHGAGMANLVFCEELTPVVEFLTPSLLRPWQIYGGHSFNLHWWPVLLDSFDSRGQILAAVNVVETALRHSQSLSGFKYG